MQGWRHLAASFYITAVLSSPSHPESLPAQEILGGEIFPEGGWGKSKYGFSLVNEFRCYFALQNPNP